MKEDLTINEFKQKRNELEVKLLTMIAREVKKFEEETGCSPSSINIIMMDVSSFEQRDKTYALVDLKVKVDL